MDQEERRRAGVAVEDRMNLQGLTVGDIARECNVDTRTIRGLIGGTRWPTVAVRSSVERLLGWQEGEIYRQAQDGMQALNGFSDAELAAEILHRARKREKPGRKSGASSS